VKSIEYWGLYFESLLIMDIFLDSFPLHAYSAYSYPKFGLGPDHMPVRLPLLLWNLLWGCGLFQDFDIGRNSLDFDLISEGWKVHFLFRLPNYRFGAGVVVSLAWEMDLTRILWARLDKIYANIMMDKQASDSVTSCFFCNE
jgi:hypothetical protein